MRPLIIFGTEAFAEFSHYYFTNDSDYTVAAFTVDGKYVRQDTFQGLPVVPFEEIEGRFPPAQADMFVAVGIREVNQFRARKVAEAEGKGYRLAHYISSLATVPKGFTLGGNSMVMEHVIVQPFAQIGRNTIIWPSSGIAFHNRIGDHCWLVTVTHGERVTVGDYTFEGLGTVVAPFVTVGRSNLIGAGALILRDTKDFEVYRGAGSKPSRVPSSRAARLVE